MALPFFRCLSYLLRHVRAGLCICLCSKPLCAFVLFCPPPTGGGTKKAHINKCITPRGQPFASLRVAASRNFDLACASQPPLLAQSRLRLSTAFACAKPLEPPAQDFGQNLFVPSPLSTTRCAYRRASAGREY